MAPGKSVNKTITIKAPVTAVWKTITDPGLMKLWMSDTPLEIVSAWKAGAPIAIHGKFHDTTYVSKGTILQFEPCKIFEYSYWNKISNVPDVPENYSIINFSLHSNLMHTRLQFTQHNFAGEATFEHANFYWHSALEVLKKLIENDFNKVT